MKRKIKDFLSLISLFGHVFVVVVAAVKFLIPLRSFFCWQHNKNNCMCRPNATAGVIEKDKKAHETLPQKVKSVIINKVFVCKTLLLLLTMKLKHDCLCEIVIYWEYLKTSRYVIKISTDKICQTPQKTSNL